MVSCTAIYLFRTEIKTEYDAKIVLTEPQMKYYAKMFYNSYCKKRN